MSKPPHTSLLLGKAGEVSPRHKVPPSQAHPPNTRRFQLETFQTLVLRTCFIFKCFEICFNKSEDIYGACLCLGTVLGLRWVIQVRTCGEADACTGNFGA